MNESSPTVTTSPTTAGTAPDDEPVLRRETIVVANDHGRLGLLVALCSMAGVAVGFGLSNIAIGLTGQGHPVRAAYEVRRVAAPALARAETPAWMGVCLGQDPEGGARIARVEPDTPAEVAGLRPGDVIVGFTAGRPARRAHEVSSPRRLVELVQESLPGQQAAVVFRRDGDLRTTRVGLTRMPQAVYDAGPYCSGR